MYRFVNEHDCPLVQTPTQKFYCFSPPCRNAPKIRQNQSYYRIHYTDYFPLSTHEKTRPEPPGFLLDFLTLNFCCYTFTTDRNDILICCTNQRRKISHHNLSHKFFKRNIQKIRLQERHLAVRLVGWVGCSRRGTLPQFLAIVRNRAVCYNHFLINEDAVKKMFFVNIRNTITYQKLWQGVPFAYLQQ